MGICVLYVKIDVRVGVSVGICELYTTILIIVVRLLKSVFIESKLEVHVVRLWKRVSLK